MREEKDTSIYYFGMTVERREWHIERVEHHCGHARSLGIDRLSLLLLLLTLALLTLWKEIGLMILNNGNVELKPRFAAENARDLYMQVCSRDPTGRPLSPLCCYVYYLNLQNNLSRAVLFKSHCRAG